MELKTLALIAAVLLAATTLDSQNHGFQDYAIRYNKSYNDIEAAYRQAVFDRNVAVMNAHNSDETQTYKMGINQFSDWTQEEFETIMLSPRATPKHQISEPAVAPVGDVDWVSRGGVTAVKDQGNCGSCWAFSAAAGTESARWLSTGTLGDHSEQQLCDCDRGINQGCSGGFEYYGVQYYASNGICTAGSYPYQSGSGQSFSCRQSSCTMDSFRVSGYTIVAGVSSLQSANDATPMMVAVDASRWSSYSSGIFSNCGSSLNHAVLLGGYTSAYWLVKNSWGGNWGESGYIRLRGNASTCGIADDASRVNY